MALTKSIAEIISEDTSGLLGIHPSWSRVPLREIATILNGFPFESTFFTTGVGMPLIRIRDVSQGKTQTFYSADYEEQFVVERGELLVGMDGDFNTARWQSGPALLNQRVCKVTVNEWFYHPKLLEFALPSYLAAINGATSSITVKHLSSRSIGDIDLPLPPLKEQTRIVEKLEELMSDLDAGVAELKAAQRKLTQYRQSLLKAAVEGALTADWRATRAASGEPQETGADLLQRILTERRARWETKQLAKFAERGKTPSKGWQSKYKEPVAPDTAGLPDLPDGWTWASVDQCSLDEASITDGPFGSNLKSAHYTESGPRVIRLQNIGDGHFVDARAHISENHYETLTKHAIAANDVVVAMLGEILPRACIVPDGVAPAIVKADCARIRLNPELLAPALLNAILNSEPTRKRVARLVKGIGRPRVNLGNLRSIPVPLPSISEQREICDALKLAIDSVVQQDEALAQGFRLATAQRKNILKAAFAGQLVPQDPNDEPASALLERIRAERATIGATRKRKTVRKRKEQA